MVNEVSNEVASAHISAVSTKQAATIGACAALIAGALSLVAAVVSGNIAAQATARTTAEQVSAQTQLSRTEFMRNERKSVYTNLLNDYRNADDILQSYSTTVLGASRGEAVRAYQKHTAPFSSAVTKITFDLNSVQLVCATNAPYDAATALRDSLNLMWTAQVNYSLTPVDASAKRDDDSAALKNASDKVATKLAEFVKTAKADIDS